MKEMSMTKWRQIHLWDLEEYHDTTGFPLFIDPEWIRGQLAMTTVSIGENRTKVWTTIDLAKCICYVWPAFLMLICLQ
jgi:hypothetical protein